MTAHLRLLTGEQLLHEGTPLVVPTLEAQPARPGEMPESLFVTLNESATECVRAGAAHTGVPTALWVRIAVEAARHLESLAKSLGSSRQELEAVLSSSASTPLGKLELLHGRRQYSYARRLREAATRATRLRAAVAARVEIAAPDWVVTAWLREAALEGVELDEYVSRLVADAPDEAVSWEARAAETGLTLGEWIYVEGLALTER